MAMEKVLKTTALSFEALKAKAEAAANKGNSDDKPKIKASTQVNGRHLVITIPLDVATSDVRNNEKELEGGGIKLSSLVCAIASVPKDTVVRLVDKDTDAVYECALNNGNFAINLGFNPMKLAKVVTKDGKAVDASSITLATPMPAPVKA